jgi:hypothetical protein
MKVFKNGVSYYTTSTVEISFPEDDVCCYRCPLMGFDYNRADREYCKKTGEFLPAARHTIGFNCPLNFVNKENEDV